MELSVKFHPVGEFSLDIQIKHQSSNTFIGLTGPSGAGKSTLLRCLAGLESQARVSGKWQSFDWATARVGLVFQDSLVFPHLSVGQNLLLAADFARKQSHNFDEVVSGCRCHHLLSRMPASLSGGEAQRVALARAVLNAPDILLLDEPVSALDSHSRHDILSYLRRLSAAGLPMLLVSHDLTDLSVYCPSLLYVEEGRIIYHGPTGKVLDQIYQGKTAITASRFGLLHGDVVTVHNYGLVEFCCEGQTLYAEHPFVHNNAVTLSIRAEAVTIDRELSATTSAANSFICTVQAVTPEDSGHYQVTLTCGETLLYARLNVIAFNQLQLHPGEAVAARFATHSFHTS